MLGLLFEQLRLECDRRSLGALVSQILFGPNRGRGPGNFYSFGLGPGPVPAPGHPGYHYSKRRRTGVDLKASVAGPWSRRRRPPAVALLPLSNFQRSRTALTLSWFQLAKASNYLICVIRVICGLFIRSLACLEEGA